MKINDFTQYFDNPQVSVFDRSQAKETPVRIGKFYPLRWDLLNFGNSVKSNSGHKMRLAPMLAPNFANMKLEEHAGVVPLRVIMEDYENTFNYATNLEGSSLPHFTSEEYHNILLALLRSGHSLQGSLMDYFGYPIYSDMFKLIVNNVADFSIEQDFSGEVVSLMDDNFPEDENLYEYYTEYVDTGFIYSGSIYYRGTTLSVNDFDGYRRLKFQPFFWWLCSKVTRMDDFLNLQALKRSVVNSGKILIDYVCEKTGSTVSTLTNQYLNYLFSNFLGLWLTKVDIPQDVNYSSLPFRAYLRVYMDWLTNGNFVNRDLYLDHIYNFESMINLSAAGVNRDSGYTYEFVNYEYLYPANRLWDYDYYTSLLPTAKADNAVEIPANSTVLDLAKLSAVQKLVLKLSYSSRYRDVIWNVFKIKPSDARLQQSSIVMERVHQIGIGENIQTSETTTSSVLGSFSGRGYSSGRSNGYHVFCEEPCIVMDFISLTAQPSYRDALHPLCHVDDILDLPIPDMDVLGNTPIYSDMVSGNILDSQTVLGYGRQYQEWLYQFGTVHGEFRTTLDFWQLVRSFDNTPVINDDFLRMNDREDFDAIFSVTDAPHGFISVFYNSRVTRHVHRSVRILI